jgi:hypothetical protein
MDLLKQVPSKGEIPDVLLRKGSIAAASLLMNRSVDVPEEEKKDDYLYEGQIRAGYDAVRSDLDPWSASEGRLEAIAGKRNWDNWGLSARFPLPIAETVEIYCDNVDDWCVGVRFGDRSPVTLAIGTKKAMIEERNRINEIRDKEGIEAYEDEIKNLREDQVWHDGEGSY